MNMIKSIPSFSSAAAEELEGVLEVGMLNMRSFSVGNSSVFKNNSKASKHPSKFNFVILIHTTRE